MPVSQILLKVSATNDIAEAVTVDVTSDILTAGKTIYNVGAANTTRWYFATLTDEAGNSSTYPLGSYTTADAVPTTDTWSFVVKEAPKATFCELTEIFWNKGSINAGMLTFNTNPTNNASGTSSLFNGNLTETGGVVRWASLSLGSTMFTIATPVTTGSVTWKLSYHRQKYRPGLRILKNGLQVYSDSALPAAAETSPYTHTYVTA